ncbi:LysR family transcriptional regulator [Yoonia sp. 208BN28-4]|uniref:LysR family transcriptional regulator n=1 Tax=Yoonia sp. 208BN28-4 TaxID=3126505 RepID=UPI0030A27DFC
MAIKIEMLKCFALVARHGSLSEAAAALGRTPSAVSMMLKQFEDHVGAPLFETSRKSHLTPLGDLIFKEAQREVTHFENTIEMIEGLSRAQAGYLRLAVTPSVANAILPAIILTFARTYPDIQVDIRDMDSATIAQTLSHDQADIGIGSLPQMAGMDRTELFSDAFGVVCRKDHPLAENWDQLTWADMQNHTLIANGLCDQITDPDFAPLLARSRLMVPNSASLLGLVREGIGITVLPRLAVRHALHEFAFLPLLDVTARRSVYMIAQSPPSQLPAAAAFCGIVHDLIASDALSLPA